MLLSLKQLSNEYLSNMLSTMVIAATPQKMYGKNVSPSKS